MLGTIGPSNRSAATIAIVTATAISIVAVGVFIVFADGVLAGWKTGSRNGCTCISGSSSWGPGITVPRWGLGIGPGSSSWAPFSPGVPRGGLAPALGLPRGH
eukprot:11160098-Lingulodinium_polyedra.AAC.1